MTEKPNIAVITGGDSSEFVVSVKSGANIFNAIDQKKFTPWLVQMKGSQWIVIQNENKIADIDKSDFSFQLNKQKITFSFAYITIHGTPGEDGILQGYFDLLRMPYSSCDVHSSSLTFNKWHCNNFLKSFGIKMAESMHFTKGKTIDAEQIISKLGLPVFVKPNSGGSSFGISKVKSKKDLLPSVEKAFLESDTVLIEEFIEGKEFTCGLVKLRNKELIFPLTEVIPKNEFFDFEAKYTPGATDEITPARLPKRQFKHCQDLSSEIYDLCSCSGIVRIDFILKNNEFYFLEVNTTPGMTETSFIPQQIGAMNLSLTEILTDVIEDKISK